MIFIENDLGFEFKCDRFFIFFGKKESSLENLKKFYPLFKFKTLHQVHGNLNLETKSSSELDRQADAHWTTEKGVGLICKTADCIPLLAYSPSEKKAIAIHAGWRGVQNRIIPNSLMGLDDWQIFIGPHILKKSFDIKEDAFELLKKCTSLEPKIWFDGRRADLDLIVEAQLAELNLLIEARLDLDTKNDLRFHSYRRDAAASGRQNSFISVI